MKSEEGAATASTDAGRCANCGAPTTRSELRDERFEYGEAPDAVRLAATVRVHRCDACGFEFTEDDADVARHEAVCRHVGVLTPAEVVAVRRRLGMNRREFAELTQFGVASLARWEQGLLLQNAANDNLLYLLSFPENAERLRRRGAGSPPASSDEPAAAGTKRRGAKRVPR